jgi:hypothetical protein
VETGGPVHTSVPAGTTEVNLPGVPDILKYTKPGILLFLVKSPLMHYHKFPFRTAALFAILLFTACTNQSAESTKGDKDTGNVSGTVNKDTGTTNVQAPEPIKACFSNDGLKYNMVITLSISGDTLTGNVSSTELDSGKEEKTNFSGTVRDTKLTVRFEGNPPPAGAASEWTKNLQRQKL